MNQKISKSYTPLKFQLIFLAVSGFLLAIFASGLVRAFNELVVGVDLSGLAKISWILVIGFTLIMMLILWSNNRSKSYELTKDSVIIGGGGIGSSNRKVYSASHITSVAARQSWLGKKYNYGKVVINMDRLEENRSVMLLNVQNPGEVADKITALIK